VVHDVSEEERRCPCCNLPRPEVHRHVREVIEITPAQVKVVRHVRPVYLCVCSPERGPVSAPAPRLPLGKARAGAGVLALIAVSKFADHAPLYRQEGMLARSGLDLSRTTMCGWLTSGAELIEPLLKLMRRCVLASKVIQTDDTPVPTLGLIIGRTKQARMWSYVGDGLHPYVVYDFTTTREAKWARQWLGDYRGDLQSDAYPGYEALELTGRIRSVGCWAHARRKFFECRELSPGFCTAVLDELRTLYDIESKLKAMPWEERARARREHAAPILHALLETLKAARGRHLPRSPVALAIGYVLDREAVFTRYLDSGHLEIDNNACERSLRAVAVGRKNWQFAGSRFGGEAAAAWFSLIGSAKLHEIEPWAYLTDVTTRLAHLGDSPSDEDLTPLLPDRWIAANPRARLPVGR
jgi:transposase